MPPGHAVGPRRSDRRTTQRQTLRRPAARRCSSPLAGTSSMAPPRARSATELGISRFRVARLLDLARSRGLCASRFRSIRRWTGALDGLPDAMGIGTIVARTLEGPSRPRRRSGRRAAGVSRRRGRPRRAGHRWGRDAHVMVGRRGRRRPRARRPAVGSVPSLELRVTPGARADGSGARARTGVPVAVPSSRTSRDRRGARARTLTSADARAFPRITPGLVGTARAPRVDGPGLALGARCEGHRRGRRGRGPVLGAAGVDGGEAHAQRLPVRRDRHHRRAALRRRMCSPPRAGPARRPRSRRRSRAASSIGSSRPRGRHGACRPGGLSHTLRHASGPGSGTRSAPGRPPRTARLPRRAARTRRRRTSWRPQSPSSEPLPAVTMHTLNRPEVTGRTSATSRRWTSKNRRAAEPMRPHTVTRPAPRRAPGSGGASASVASRSPSRSRARRSRHPSPGPSRHRPRRRATVQCVGGRRTGPAGCWTSMNITSGPRHAARPGAGTTRRRPRCPCGGASTGGPRSIDPRSRHGRRPAPRRRGTRCLPRAPMPVRVEQQPGLRLAVRANQVLAREVRVGVAMDGRPCPPARCPDQEGDAGRTPAACPPSISAGNAATTSSRARGVAVERLDHRPALDTPVGVGVASRRRRADRFLGPVVVATQGHARNRRNRSPPR